MKVVIANWSTSVAEADDIQSFWGQHQKPPRLKPPPSLFDYPAGWGFHILSLGLYLMDTGEAQEVEYWDRRSKRRMTYHSSGVLRIDFLNEHDVMGYLNRYGYPDLFINYGRQGHVLLSHLNGKCFRVNVPCLRSGYDRKDNFGAECYLVDSEEFLDDRSMLYIPVVNTEKIRPVDREKKRDFIYLADFRLGKRHDMLLKAVRDTFLTGHLHPVDASKINLSNTRVTTSNWDERDVLELLTTSRMAVYLGDYDSNPAAMWECVAAGLPIVVNEQIKGGKYVVVPGVTGELATEDTLYEVMTHVLSNLESYRPRAYFEEHWNTLTWLERYLSFFCEMGWNRPKGFGQATENSGP